QEIMRPTAKRLVRDIERPAWHVRPRLRRDARSTASLRPEDGPTLDQEERAKERTSAAASAKPAAASPAPRLRRRHEPPPHVVATIVVSPPSRTGHRARVTEETSVIKYRRASLPRCASFRKPPRGRTSAPSRSAHF